MPGHANVLNNVQNTIANLNPLQSPVATPPDPQTIANGLPSPDLVNSALGGLGAGGGLNTSSAVGDTTLGPITTGASSGITMAAPSSTNQVALIGGLVILVLLVLRAN